MLNKPVLNSTVFVILLWCFITYYYCYRIQEVTNHLKISFNSLQNLCEKFSRLCALTGTWFSANEIVLADGKTDQGKPKTMEKIVGKEK